MSRNGSTRQWRKLREKVLEDSAICYICGREVDMDAPPYTPLSPTVDHVISVSEWPEGEFVLENLKTCCYECNTHKNAKPLIAVQKNINSRRWY